MDPRIIIKRMIPTLKQDMMILNILDSFAPNNNINVHKTMIITDKGEKLNIEAS